MWLVRGVDWWCSHVSLLSLSHTHTHTHTLPFHLSSLHSPLPVAASLFSQDYLLGYESTSDLGVVGAMLEVSLIIYFMFASVVGLYSTPRLKWLLPVLHDTSMTKVNGLEGHCTFTIHVHVQMCLVYVYNTCLSSYIDEFRL